MPKARSQKPEALMLLIAGQAIKFANIGLAENGEFVFEERIEGEPETFLKGLDNALGAWKVDRQEIEAVAVAGGPGSATALRTSVTLANTIGFSLSIPVYSVQISPDESLQKLAQEAEKTTPSLAVPAYSSPPKITKPSPKTG